MALGLTINYLPLSQPASLLGLTMWLVTIGTISYFLGYAIIRENLSDYDSFIVTNTFESKGLVENEKLILTIITLLCILWSFQ